MRYVVKYEEIRIVKVASEENIGDVLTKSLLRLTFKYCLKQINFCLRIKEGIVRALL